MQASTEIVYVYVARQSYRGTGNNDPSMEVNDVIHVTAEFLHSQNVIPESPDGWLCGTNIRTGQEGYFPGYFLVLNGSHTRTVLQRRRPPPPPDVTHSFTDKQWNPARTNPPCVRSSDVEGFCSSLNLVARAKVPTE